MYVINIHVIYNIWSRVPCSHPPPHGMGGGMMPLWWCIYIPTYLPTYLRTYIHTITLPYLTLPTLHYLTLHSIHTYIPTYIHTYHTLHYLTNIPTYQHTTTTGHRGGGPEEPYHHHRPQGGGGPEEPYHHHRPQGGGQKNQTILSTHTHWWGGEGGWPTLHHIYICNAWALPQRCSVEGSHSQSNVAATLHSIGKINKGIREY